MTEVDIKWRERFVGIGTFLLACFAMFIFVVCAFFVSRWYNERIESVVSSTSAGEIVTAEFISVNLTRVVTSQGTFLVHGAFQAIKDHSAVIEKRESGAIMLCDTVSKICKKLVD